MKDWNKVKRMLENKAKNYAVIDWFELDKILGTSTKKIYIYYKGYVVSEMPYDEARVKFLSKYIPVVDLTRGRPYPEEFDKIPRRSAILGRLNLIDLNLPE